MPAMDRNEEAMVVACADLIGRCGAKDFEIGFLREDVPIEEAGWYAKARYNEHTFDSGEHRLPGGAARALAERLLEGGLCKCGQQVTLTDDKPGCRWRLTNPPEPAATRWESGCDAPSIEMTGERGDLAALHAQMGMNREARRALKKAQKRGEV